MEKLALEPIHIFLVAQAKNMLLSKNGSMGEIAYRLGFENSFCFSKLFKNEVDIDPPELKCRKWPWNS